MHINFTFIFLNFNDTEAIGAKLHNTMCNIIDKTKMIIFTILILLIFTNRLCWSLSENSLILKNITFKNKSLNYLIDFTLEIYNSFDKAIESIDAFIIFEDKKGNILSKVYIKPNFKILSNNSTKETWTHIMNPFCRMLKMKKDDIQAKLLVRAITFSTGQRILLMAETNVVY
jgi:hypothetical protein